MKKVLLFLAAALVIMAGFFFLTAYLSKPSRLKIVKEDMANEKEPILEEAQIQLYLSHDAIYAITGEEGEKGFYTIETIPKLIADHKQKWNDSLFVQIKTYEEHSYKNVVDILDQMTIHQIKNYNIAEVTTAEKKKLEKHFKQFP